MIHNPILIFLVTAIYFIGNSGKSVKIKKPSASNRDERKLPWCHSDSSESYSNKYCRYATHFTSLTGKPLLPTISSVRELKGELGVNCCCLPPSGSSLKALNLLILLIHASNYLLNIILIYTGRQDLSRFFFFLLRQSATINISQI